MTVKNIPVPIKIKIYVYTLFKAFDPLDLGNVGINQGFDLKLNKYTAFGTSNFKIDKIRVNVENFQVDIFIIY